MSDYLYNTHPEFLAAYVRAQKAKEQAPSPLDAAACSESEPEILENATCDGCGNTNTFVQVINCPPVSVGICLCRGCLESDSQNNAISNSHAN
jgi:hypothetical protein